MDKNADNTRSLPSSFKCLNIDKALKLINDKEHIYLKFVKAYRASYDIGVYDLDPLFDDKNYAEVTKVLHALKGVCGSLGAETAFEQAQALESQFERDDLEGAEERLNTLSKTLSDLNGTIDELLNSIPP